jgi:hypothetical protein
VSRPNWSRPLPQPLKIPDIMTLRTLADARTLLSHVPAQRRQFNTWRHVAKCIDDAAHGGDVASAVIALRIVLMLEHVPCKPQ